MDFGIMRGRVLKPIPQTAEGFRKLSFENSNRSVLTRILRNVLFRSVFPELNYNILLSFILPIVTLTSDLCNYIPKLELYLSKTNHRTKD